MTPEQQKKYFSIKDASEREEFYREVSAPTANQNADALKSQRAKLASKLDHFITQSQDKSQSEMRRTANEAQASKILSELEEVDFSLARLETGVDNAEQLRTLAGRADVGEQLTGMRNTIGEMNATPE